MFKLRDYQRQTVDDVERHKKNLIYLATGSGKSVVFKQLAVDALKQNEKVLFIVKRQQVLSQAVNKHFLSIHNDVSMMMGSNKFRFADILCCSMDTLYRRQHLYDELLNRYQNVLIDEAHDCTADNYQSFFIRLTNQTVSGLTATPFAVGKKTHHFWDKVIHPVNTLDLIKQGHLVWPEVWMSSHTMKTKGVKTTAGDYNSKQLFQANDDSVIYGSLVDEYIKHGKNKRCFSFCINVEHSKKVSEAYNNMGIKAVHADADTPLVEREKMLRAFANGEIKIITNVNIFSTGTDVPEAEVGQMARPTKSKILWIQQVGRILRPCPEINKKHAIILDHTDNTINLGHPAINDFIAETSIEDTKENAEKLVSLYQCKKCFYVFGEKTNTCPMCGEVNETKERIIKEEKDAELRKWEAQKQKPCEYEKLKKLYFKKITDEDGVMFFLRDKIFNKAKKYGHKKWSILFKTYELEKEHNTIGLTINYPKWFLDIQSNNEQISTTPEFTQKLHD